MGRYNKVATHNNSDPKPANCDALVRMVTYLGLLRFRLPGKGGGSTPTKQKNRRQESSGLRCATMINLLHPIHVLDREIDYCVSVPSPSRPPPLPPPQPIYLPISWPIQFRREKKNDSNDNNSDDGNNDNSNDNDDHNTDNNSDNITASPK